MSDSHRWALSRGQSGLGENEIQVWRASLDCEETAVRRFEAILAPEERARADRFVFPSDRNRFMVARGILRELLGKYVNRSPAELEFDYHPKGKPFLGRQFDSPIQFNISHSHGLALLAFASGSQLGIDVELIRPDFAGEEIAERFFSGEEVRDLRALPQARRAEGFFRCWTLKEAYVKARGEGLNIPLDSFHVCFTPGQPERLKSADSSRWSLRSLDPDPRYAGALVVEGAGRQPSYWEWKA
jgi:4'-phosphopantetheinyl transferase